MSKEVQIKTAEAALEEYKTTLRHCLQHRDSTVTCALNPTIRLDKSLKDQITRRTLAMLTYTGARDPRKEINQVVAQHRRQYNALAATTTLRQLRMYGTAYASFKVRPFPRDLHSRSLPLYSTKCEEHNNSKSSSPCLYCVPSNVLFILSERGIRGPPTKVEFYDNYLILASIRTFKTIMEELQRRWLLAFGEKTTEFLGSELSNLLPRSRFG